MLCRNNELLFTARLKCRQHWNIPIWFVASLIDFQREVRSAGPPINKYTRGCSVLEAGICSKYWDFIHFHVLSIRFFKSGWRVKRFIAKQYAARGCASNKTLAYSNSLLFSMQNYDRLWTREGILNWIINSVRLLIFLDCKASLPFQFILCECFWLHVVTMQ